VNQTQTQTKVVIFLAIIVFGGAFVLSINTQDDETQPTPELTPQVVEIQEQTTNVVVATPPTASPTILETKVTTIVALETPSIATDQDQPKSMDVVETEDVLKALEGLTAEVLEDVVIITSTTTTDVVDTESFEIVSKVIQTPTEVDESASVISVPDVAVDTTNDQADSQMRNPFMPIIVEVAHTEKSEVDSRGLKKSVTFLENDIPVTKINYSNRNYMFGGGIVKKSHVTYNENGTRTVLRFWDTGSYTGRKQEKVTYSPSNQMLKKIVYSPYDQTVIYERNYK